MNGGWRRREEATRLQLSCLLCLHHNLPLFPILPSVIQQTSLLQGK